MADMPDADGGESYPFRERSFTRDKDPATQGAMGTFAFYFVFGICVLISIFIRVL
jgi:hypothetical protein